MAFFILLVVLLKSIGTLSNAHEYFNITRRPLILTDLFQLPPSLCGESKGTTECPLMGGRKIGDCQCACDMKDDKGVTYKSTFGFYDGEWKCVNNSALRRDTGCLSVVQHKGDVNTPIPTIDGKSPTRWRTEHRHKGNGCQNVTRRLHYNLSYQNCNGSWEFLNKIALAIHREAYVCHFSYGRSSISNIVSIIPSQSYPLPSGRLIRLVLELQNPVPTTCFYLKVEGNLKCDLPPITSTSPPTNPSFLNTSLTINDSSYSSSSTKVTSWLIASTLSGAIVFIIVITVIVVIVTRKRKRHDNSARIAAGEMRKSESRKRETNPQTAEDHISDASYVDMNHDLNLPDELEYEIMSNTAETDESKAIKQLEERTSKELDSTAYFSLVGNEPHVYCFLKGPHKTHEDETDRQYQQLTTFGQQNHGEYQALK